MVKTSKIPTVILDPDSLNQGNTIPEGAIIITAPKKKKSRPRGTKAPGTPPKKKRFRDSPYPQFNQEFKPKIKIKAFKGGGRAYGKNS